MRGTEAAGLMDPGQPRLRSGVELPLSEHFLAKHVGLTEEMLRRRLIDDGTIAASSFADEEPARWAVDASYWGQKMMLNQARGTERAGRLRAAGWTALWLREHESAPAVVAEITRHVDREARA